MSTKKIIKRQSVHTRFHNEDMDFLFNFMLGYSSLGGLSHGEMFAIAAQIKDGDAGSWRQAFGSHADWLEQDLKAEFAPSQAKLASRHYGIFHALRAQLQLADPTEPGFETTINRMESHFQTACSCSGYPLEAVEIPFEQASLSGYLLRAGQPRRPTLIMVGGGDTYREDLFYFGGLAGFRRGYNVLMADLPGQGKLPFRKLTFRHDTEKPISVIADWLEAKHLVTPNKLAIFGLSGGGYFTARAVSLDKRFTAWVASTPITDMSLVFEREMPKSLVASPGWLQQLLIRLVGTMNDAAQVNIKKYFWQAGITSYDEAMEKIVRHCIVDVEKITCNCLFLMGDNEAGELVRQTNELYEHIKANPKNSLRRFRPEEAGDAHCQVNNLPLAQIEIFDWLDRVLA
jgi:pimeloyl-ACP methyl ester carboxylesterase